MILLNNFILRHKNILLIHFNWLLFCSKILLSFFLFILTLKLSPKIETQWFWFIWIFLSLFTDSILIWKKPAIFDRVVLNKNQRIKYHINSKEFRRYLIICPKIRLIRTLLLVLIIFFLFSAKTFESRISIVLMFGSILIDTLVKNLMKVKSPSTSQTAYYNSTPSLREIHRANPDFCGSDAWLATHNNREYLDNLQSRRH